MIDLENVKKSYATGVQALNGISLHIDRGEFVFIVGDSGSGKSTLIKLLLKELDPTSGTIKVNGINLNRMKPKAIPKYRRKLGVVFQDFRLLKARNVYGEQQRVALARALVNQPNILLADEPTGNLDPKNSKEIMKLLETINERGTTVVVVTHNQEIVDAMKKRVIAMHKGVIISDERKAGYTQHAD